MAAKRQTAKPSNNVTALSNNVTWRDIINGSNLLMLEPGKNDWRKRFMLALYEWAEDPESLELEDFYWKMKIKRKVVYDWREKYEDIREAINEVKLKLGSRKRGGAIKKLYDRDSAYRDMHVLDPEWDKVNKYHAQLRNIEAAIEEMRVIAIPNARDTGKVTPRVRATDVTQNQE